MKFSELLSNKFIRITLMVFFFLFVYDILFAVGLFFAIDSVVLSMYLCWIGMIVLFASLLQNKRTNFNVTPPKIISISKITEGVATAIQQGKEVANQIQSTVQPGVSTVVPTGATVVPTVVAQQPKP
jgi:hypothetical protein